MKRVPLVALALIIGAVACQEVSAPTPSNSSSGPALRFRVSNPPPPPIDTGATGSFSATQQSVPASIQQSSPFGMNLSILRSVPSAPSFAFDQQLYSFSLPVVYFFDKTTNSGYLKFGSDPENSVLAPTNGAIKYSKGTFSGKGIVEIQVTGGVLAIDLSSILATSLFGCPPIVPSVSAPGGPPAACFHLEFGQATFTPTGGSAQEGTAQMDPGCPPDNNTYPLCVSEG